MTNGLDVFNVGKGQLAWELDEAKKTLNGKLNSNWVKTRQQGNTTLSYIGGHTVIRLLNKAFNYQWSFEIVSEEVVKSLPKYDKYKKTEVAQPPVAKVLGRLTVPGLGVKEQYGSKVLIGGATEQESAFKAASTDAMKKCASLFGIGLDLYGEDEGLETTDEMVEEGMSGVPVQTPQEPTPAPQYEQHTYVPPVEDVPPTPEPEQAPPAKQEQAPAQQASTVPGGWNQQDINRLKELKQILGITDNAQLDPYVREFFDNPNVTYANINPDNIKAVNIFLAKKAEVV